MMQKPILNINLKAANMETEYTKEQIENCAKCAAFYLEYFIETYINVVSLDEESCSVRISKEHDQLGFGSLSQNCKTDC